MAREYREDIYMGVAPVTHMNAVNVYMADGSTAEEAITDLQAQACKKFELIEEITLTEDTVVIERTTEPDGTPYNFSDILITSIVPNSSDTAAQGVYTINNIYGYGYSNTIRANNEAYNKFIYSIDKGIGFDFGTGGTTQNTQSGYVGHMRADLIDNITSLKINSNPATVAFPTNTLLKIYAVRT